MSQTNSTLEELTLEFKALRNPRKPEENQNEVFRLVGLIEGNVSGAAFNEVLRAFECLVSPGEALRRIELCLLNAAANKATSVEDLERLSRVDEVARGNFRGLFLLHAVRLTKDKDELVDWLKRLEYLH
ncbi:MAG: hypothetical protein WC030_02420 [Candidatus Paceibacterota bacterium]